MSLIPSHIEASRFSSSSGGVAVLERERGNLELRRVVPLGLRDNLVTGIVLTHDGNLLIATAQGPGMPSRPPDNAVAFLDVSRLESGKGNALLGMIRDGDRAGSVYVDVSADDRLAFVSDERMRRVTVDVSQKRRCTTALGRPFRHAYSFPILQHASSQPFLDEPHDAPVCDPVLDEFHKPFVGKSIEEAFDIQIEHPVHFSRQQSRVERVQRLMLAAPRSESVREAKKIRFVDSVHHLDRRALDDLVFQRRHSERSLPPVGLRDVHPTHRLRSVRSTLQPIREVLEIYSQFLAVVPPRLPVHARRSFLLQTEVSHAKRFQVVDVAA